MLPDPYDLTPLLHELQGVAGGGRSLGRGELSAVRAVVARAAGEPDPDRAFAVFTERLRVLEPGRRRAKFAGDLLQVAAVAQYGGPRFDRPARQELLRAGLEAFDEPRWREVLHNAAMVLDLLDEAAGVGDTPSRGHGAPGRTADPDDPAFSRAARFPAADSAKAALLDAAQEAERAQQSGGEAELEAATAKFASALAQVELQAGDRAYFTAFHATLRAELAYRRNDTDELAACILDEENALRGVPGDHLHRAGAEAWLANDVAKQRVLGARESGRLPEPAPAPDRAAPPPGAPASEVLDHAMTLVSDALSALAPERARAGIDLLTGVLAQLDPSPDGPYDPWVRCATALGSAHLLRAALLRDSHAGLLAEGTALAREIVDHVIQGTTVLKRALTASGGPAHPQWAAIGTSLATGYRFRSLLPGLTGSQREQLRARARSTGLAALPGFAWSVLLQSGTDHATQAGSRAAERALDIARWCVEDDRPAEAVQALDAGRGLLLHAARTAATVPDMLTELGRPDLAAQWRSSTPAARLATAGGPFGVGDLEAGGGERPVPLRREVLDTLGRSPYRSRLLDPPAAEEIGTALRSTRAEALVYLVPGGTDGLRGDAVPGAAVCVLPDGSVRTVRLPGLLPEAPQFTAYLDLAPAGGGRVAGSQQDHAAAFAATQAMTSDTRRAALDGLCGWAWEVAVRHVVDALGSSAAVPSIVLIPVGVLGLVPWHAAWREVRAGLRGRARRYAVQDLRISYAPSARMLCGIADRGPRSARERASGPVLVVGNPEGNLEHAGREAAAIHRVFHPHGVLLEGPAGTAHEVAARLRRSPGGVLHLACHGLVEPGGRHSALLRLACRTRLSAEEVAESAGRLPTADEVFLAACVTQVSGRGHDEAYSLAAAFLVAGARSVVGTLWPVPDGSTSLLMYMTHHAMCREGLSPARAVHRAQLWMLDEQRAAPPGMPEQLAALVGDVVRDDVAGWAGFTALGW